MPHDVFISHSESDKTVAQAICAKLEDAALRCWISPRDVQPGRSFAGEITRAIKGSRAMLLVFSSHSNTSDQVLREVQLAAESHLHIVQFRIEPVVPSDDFAYFLGTPHWLDALTPPLEEHIGRLVMSMRALLANPGVLPPPLPNVADPAPTTGSLGAATSIPLPALPRREPPQVPSPGRAKLAKASFIISMVGIGAWFLVLLVAGIGASSGASETSPLMVGVGLCMFAGMAANLTGAIFGLVTFRKPIPNKWMAVTGTIVNAVELVGVLILMIVGLASS